MNLIIITKKKKYVYTSKHVTNKVEFMFLFKEQRKTKKNVQHACNNEMKFCMYSEI